MSWPQMKLESLASRERYSFVGGPFGSKLTSRDYVDHGIPVIRGSNLNNGRYLDLTEFVYVSDSKVREDLSSNLAKPLDLVFTQRGTLGQVAIIPDDGISDRYVVSQSQMKLTVDDAKADRLFIYYYFSSRQAIERITNFTSSSGVPHINLTVLRNFEVPVPPLETQRRIASILSAYDDLIENNRRRIQLLEQAARLLYKEWFVHLRFPGHEHVRIMNGVPEGWAESTIANVCTSFDDGDWIESKDQGGEDYRLLQISNIGDNDFVETVNFRYITAETFRRLRCNEVVPGDILISRMPKPIGRAWYVQEMPWRMVTVVDVTIARPNLDIADPFYFLYHINSPNHLALCELRATGATRPRISRKNMGALPILVPPLSLQRSFSETATAVSSMRHALRKQNDSLARSRDMLLPRLMNGEIAA
ncbi:MAG: restriction endonuclease subunit S [Pseudomonadota bacterium]